jgi:hypothetical protein
VAQAVTVAGSSPANTAPNTLTPLDDRWPRPGIATGFARSGTTKVIARDRVVLSVRDALEVLSAQFEGA